MIEEDLEEGLKELNSMRIKSKWHIERVRDYISDPDQASNKENLQKEILNAVTLASTLKSKEAKIKNLLSEIRIRKQHEGFRINMKSVDEAIAKADDKLGATSIYENPINKEDISEDEIYRISDENCFAKKRDYDKELEEAKETGRRLRAALAAADAALEESAKSRKEINK